MISSGSRREHWSDIIAKQQSSGLSAARWCRDNNIEANNFYNWRKRLGEASSLAGADPAAGQWLALGAVNQNAHSSGLTLRVGLISIEVTPGFDRRLLTDVLGIVKSAC